MKGDDKNESVRYVDFGVAKTDRRQNRQNGFAT